jgi:O-succinylbenzoate synthase
MKIADFILYRYTLPLTRPINVKGGELTERSGFAIKLADENGHCGFGEASPLPSFSFENLETVASQLLSLRYSLSGEDIPRDLEELSYGFARWLERFDLAPSVRFGFETAVLNLIANSRNLPLRKVISDVFRDTVSVNGLLSGTRDEILSKAARLQQVGYKAVKLKVGQRPLHEEIRLVRDVREQISDDVALRLDANRVWCIDDALIFLREVSSCQIDYLEEPVKDYRMFVSLCDKTDSSASVAMDESLTELTPEELTHLPNLKAIVLKPTLLGFERSVQFGRRATFLGVTPIISSSFETSLGLTALAELASVLNTTDVSVGLDTIGWFKEDLLRTPLRIEKGRMSLSNSVIRPDQIRRELLQEVAHV